MPKSFSEHETIISTNKQKRSKKVSWLHERTKQAVNYYSKTKHEDLKSAKQKYLQKIGYPDSQNNKKGENKMRQQQIQDEQARPIFRKTRIQSKKKSPQLDSLSINSSSLDKNHRIEDNNLDSQSVNSLQQIGKYPLTNIHNLLIGMQKSIDSFLDFQFCNRNKRGVSKQDLVGYLKTTEFSLNCEKYIQYLMIYNKSLYTWSKEIIFCRRIDPQQSEKRAEETKILMTRKEIKDIAI